ncbi:MAG TPA: hypothetical protein VIS73_03080 [Rhodocyclaceae bacterium]
MQDARTTYVKTPKGLDEIEHKTNGLHLKARQVLIMIDGKRDIEALQGIFPPEMVPAVLEELLREGYVRELARPKAPPPPRPVPTAQLDGEDPFDLSQTFMINIARKILGIAGDEIVAKVEAARDLETLRGLFPEWRKAITQAPDGVMRIKEFEFKLFQVLGEVSPNAAPATPEKPKNPPTNDDERFILARNFMVNTARNYLGIVADSFVPKVDDAQSLADLRHLFFEWREALRQSPDAKRRLAEYESKLAALLS